MVASGLNKYGECDVTAWKQIRKIVTSDDSIVGITKEGTVKYAGKYSDLFAGLSEWTDIIDVLNTGQMIVGLKANGDIVGICNNRDYSKELHVPDWHNIKKLAGTIALIVGLKDNGEVECIGHKEEAVRVVSCWKGIVDIYVTYNANYDINIYGLDWDGNVKYHTIGGTERDYKRTQLLPLWHDIIKLYQNKDFLIGIRRDGSLISDDSELQKLIDPIRLFESIETIQDEIAKANQEYEAILQREKEEEHKRIKEAQEKKEIIRKHNEPLLQKIKELEDRRDGQVAVTEKYRKAFFGKGVKLRDEAWREISKIDEEIRKLKEKLQ